MDEESLQRQDDIEFLELREELQLDVLHGRHRLQAGKLYLYPEDRWWVVDLYDDGIYHRIHLRRSMLTYL